MKAFIQVNPAARTDTSNIEPFVHRAIAQLGTFEAGYEKWLLEAMRIVFDEGHMGRKVRSLGTPLTHEQRHIIGFEDRYEPLTIEACAALNDIGIVKPIEVYDNFCRLVTSLFHISRKMDGFARLATVRPWIRHVAGPNACAVGKRRHGAIVPYADLIPLPLPGCTRPYCGCDLQQLSDRDREKLKG